MENKGTVLAVLAILIGVGTFGYLFYQQQSGALTGSSGEDGDDGVNGENAVVATWYDDQDGVNLLNDGGHYDVPGIFIEFDVRSGEKAYYLFTGCFQITPNAPGELAYVMLFFKVDGDRLNVPDLVIGCDYGSEVYSNGVLQFVDDTLSPGQHNITMQYSTSYCLTSSTGVMDRSLLVQTLNN